MGLGYAMTSHTQETGFGSSVHSMFGMLCVSGGILRLLETRFPALTTLTAFVGQSAGGNVLGARVLSECLRSGPAVWMDVCSAIHGCQSWFVISDNVNLQNYDAKCLFVVTLCARNHVLYHSIVLV